MNKTCRDKKFTLKDLFEQFDDRDLVPFAQFSKYKFIYAYDDGEECDEADISVVYKYEGKYYEVCSSQYVKYGYDWDPIEVEEKHLKERYPEINLETDIFGHNTK